MKNETITITKGKKFNAIDFTFTRGLRKGESYLVSLYCCCNFRCTSKDLRLVFTANGKDNADNLSYTVFFNLETRDLSSNNEQLMTQTERNFAQCLKAELTETDWELLSQYYQTAKSTEAQKLGDSEVFDFANIENDIETESATVSYGEVFPCAESLEFQVEHEAFIVVDQYCVKKNAGANTVLYPY